MRRRRRKWRPETRGMVRDARGRRREAKTRAARARARAPSHTSRVVSPPWRAGRGARLGGGRGCGAVAR
eukprot:453554-Prymnesium_polylepis.1